MLMMALTGILVPAFLCGILLLVTSLVKGTKDDQASSSVGLNYPAMTGVALSLSYMATHWALVGRPAFPWLELPPSSIEAKHWIFHAALLGAFTIPAVEFLSEKKRFWGRWLVRLLLLIVVVGGTLLSQVLNTWTTGSSVLIIAAVTSVFLAHYASWDALWREDSGASQSFYLMIQGSAVAVVIMLSGSASLAQLTGALTSAVGAVWVLALMKRYGALCESACTVIATVLLGLLLNAVIFLDFSYLDAGLLVLSCHLPWIVKLPKFHDRPKLRLVVAIVLVMIPLAGAVGHSYANYEEPYSYEDF